MFPYSELLRAKEIDEELENIEAKVLDQLLCWFIVEVKKKEGGEYEPTTLRSFISSFDRYLRRKGYPTTIIDGQEFRKTRETLVAKQKELKKAGKGNKTKATRALTDEEVDILYSIEVFKSKYGVRCTFLNYTDLLAAIPKNWKNAILDCNQSVTN